MTIHRFIAAFGASLFFFGPSVVEAQHTVTDQYGTEILLEALPAPVRRDVSASRATRYAPEGPKPLKIDNRGRYQLTKMKGEIDRDKPVVSQLLGVVLLPGQSEVRRHGWPGVEGVWHDFEHLPKPVGETLKSYLGRPISLNGLDQMVEAVNSAYGRAGYPVVEVSLPMQKYDAGVVQLVVVQATLARVKVRDADIDTEAFIQRSVRSRKGEVIRTGQVLKDLAWVNRASNRRVEMFYEPGLEAGTADMVLTNSEFNGDWFALGYDDSGTNALGGGERIAFGFNFGDMFGPNVLLDYQFMTDLDLEHLKSHTLTYTQGLAWRHWVSVMASFTEIDGTTIPGFGGLSRDGDNLGLAVTYGIPLRSTAERSRSFELGFEFKSIGSTVEFIDPAATYELAELNGPTVEVFQFTFGYSDEIRHSNALTQFDIKGVLSPGGVTNHNSTAAFAANRTGADPSYFYVRSSFEHQAEMHRDWRMRLRVDGQKANGNLIASEQLGAGGYDTVRGFDQQVLSGDSGVVGSVELYTPNLAWGTRGDSFRLLGFFDFAALSSEDRLPAEPVNERVGSIGMGMRWDYSDSFSLRVDYGHPVFTKNVGGGVNPVDESGRFHVGATATF